MNTAARIPLVLPVAATVTIGLFMMMRNLIDVGEVEIPIVEDPPDIEISFDIVPVDPIIDRFDPIDIDLAPPDRVRIETPAAAVDSEVHAINVAVLPTIEAAEVTTTTPFIPDQNVQPYFRLRPTYPPRMANRGVSGSCRIGFDVTPQGGTANVRALSCTNDGFSRAAIQAVSGWRYQPRVVDGQPRMREGMAVVIEFEMEA
jgi:protein TonB